MLLDWELFVTAGTTRYCEIQPPLVALALMNTASMDAGICCWKAKYDYWYPRPIQADPTIKTAFPTPNFPSYTSGHSDFSAAAGGVLSYIFPKEKSEL